jgi:hypothetical protein
MTLKKPGTDCLHYAVVVQCDGHGPQIEDWAENLADATVLAAEVLKTAVKEQWGSTDVWVMQVRLQGAVS